MTQSAALHFHKEFSLLTTNHGKKQGRKVFFIEENANVNWMWQLSFTFHKRGSEGVLDLG